MKISLLFFWLFTLMLSSASTKAQRYQFQIFSTADGLIDSNVTCINQSKQGNLWIGTEKGLSIFDGIKFRNFTINNGLAENWITTILPLTSGDVILGHKTGYLSLYDLKSKSFKPILSAQNLESHEVKQLAQIDSNSIVIVSDKPKVYKFKLNQEYQISDLNFGDKIQHIKKVLALDSNRYLVAHNKGLDLIKNNRRSSLVKNHIIDFALLSNKLIVALSPQRIYSFNSKERFCQEVFVNCIRILMRSLTLSEFKAI